MIDRLTTTAYRLQEDKAKLEKSIAEIVEAEAAGLRHDAAAYRRAAEALPDRREMRAAQTYLQAYAEAYDGIARHLLRDSIPF